MKKYVITATDGTERAIYRKSFDEAFDQAIRENACCIKNERGVLIAGSQSNPKACFEAAERLMRDFPYSREDFRNAYGREPERYLDYLADGRRLPTSLGRSIS